eukprot:TRINITY_DN4151_c0_g1_i1.p1 TRINITY_DN4151_c0_g1~~TRINITY_DN4151_c0_g1_i1.p1  ORF type:complete len:1282 (+),score=365.70 TRINITY_DN4151_c0_g1_i1:151-3996(+)
MSEKQKSKDKDKDKDKKRKEDTQDDKEAKRVRQDASVKETKAVDENGKKEKKDKDKKEKKEKDKDKDKKKKDKEKNKKESTENPDQKKAPEKAPEASQTSGQDKRSSDAAPKASAEKKLKAWQDDELEVESDEEKSKDASNTQALADTAAASSDQTTEKKTEAESDPLDAYMADLAKDDDAPGKDSQAMGVMGASQVKSITLEEIEALMGNRKQETVEQGESAAEKVAPAGSEQIGGSSSSSAMPDSTAPLAAEVTAAPDDEQEDEKFHAAFMEQMRKLRGGQTSDEQQEEFMPAKSFSGARPGFVFKRGKKGLGYYKDLGPFAVTTKGASGRSDKASSESKAVPDFRRDRKTNEQLDEDLAETDQAKQAGDEDEEEADAAMMDDSAGIEVSEELAKVVETKKEKRRKRREAKEAEAKAKAEAAKKRAKDGFGEGDGEWMDSDPDRSEESSEEPTESYFDLVKRFTTKKTLPAVEHDKIEYKPFRKNLYIQVKEITIMKDHEVENLRRTHGDITVRGKRCPHPITSFLQCGLPDRIMKILEKRDYESPFPVQMQAIPALMCGRDLIGVAQTGSGKTLAYLLPVIRHILDQPKLGNGDGPVAFVVAPTRELALQIQREASVFCKAVNLTSVCAYGGGPMGEQLSALKKGAELLVGTPGRLIDVLTISGGKITNLRRVTFLVLDEADRMFDMGFEPQIGMFLQSTRPDKQVAMFSATLPAHVEALARTVLKKPLEITVGERNTAATNVVQFVEVLDESQKFYRLLQLLGEWHEHGAIIIFVHKQQDVDEMFTELLKYGYPPLALHGGQDQQDRDFTLQDFKDGVSNILIATSVAARGIDVKNVILVVNFKVPDHLEDYIHRIGRTGRAGKAGYAYTFIQPDEASHAQDMVDALRQCNQEVPLKLKALAEEHQTAINKGEAEKRKRWGGFGGKGFKYDNTEKSRQQKDRQSAKAELLIGDMDDEDDEFRDPWFEPDAPAQGKGKGRGKGKKDGDNSAQSKASTRSGNTVAAAHEVAAKMQADANAASGGAKAPPPPPPKAAIATKSDKEIEEQAQLMAEETLKTLPDEVRDEKLPALKEKLILKLRKAEKDKLAAAATALAKVPAPPPKETEPEVPPLLKAIPLVPGVLGQGFVPAKDNMVANAISSLQAQAGKPGRDKSAEDKALLPGYSHLAGQCVEELEINDYPQIARQKITHRDPLVAIEEMTGCRVQVRGQHFLPNAKMPEGARKLYVECVGPTTVAVSKAKHEVYKMMEALAIRTLNIPGLTNKIGGTPGKYNPASGM